MFDTIDLRDRPVTMLGAAVDALAGEDPAVVRSGVVADQVVDLARLIDRLQVEWWRRAGELDARDHHRVDGAVSTAAWIRWRCRTTVAKAPPGGRHRSGVAGNAVDRRRRGLRRGHRRPR